jgi:hypothetical protein
MVDSARAVLNDFLPDVWVYTDHCKAVWDMDLPWPGEFAILIFIEHHFKESLESVAIHGQIFT